LSETVGAISGAKRGSSESKWERIKSILKVIVLGHKLKVSV